MYKSAYAYNDKEDFYGRQMLFRTMPYLVNRFLHTVICRGSLDGPVLVGRDRTLFCMGFFDLIHMVLDTHFHPSERLFYVV